MAIPFLPDEEDDLQRILNILVESIEILRQVLEQQRLQQPAPTPCGPRSKCGSENLLPVHIRHNADLTVAQNILIIILIYRMVFWVLCVAFMLLLQISCFEQLDE